MEFPVATKSQSIRGMLAMFKAKATDQRQGYCKTLSKTTNPETKKLCEHNIAVLDRHIDRCSKLTRSKTLCDLNTNNVTERFMDMIIVGHYEGERIEFDVKNMERVKSMKKVKTPA